MDAAVRSSDEIPGAGVEGGFRRLAGPEELPVVLPVGDELNPQDVVVWVHGMSFAADRDFQSSVGGFDEGHVAVPAAAAGLGVHGHHGPTAANQLDPALLENFDHRVAQRTPMEL